MKKHDEGYTIPLVLVVMVIMILVASLVLANSLQTAQNQQEAILQMKDKYAAEGKIEILVAQLLDKTGYAAPDEINEEKVTEVIINRISQICEEINDPETAVGSLVVSSPEMDLDTTTGVFTYTFKVVSIYQEYKITTQMALSGTVAKKADDKLEITSPQITYETYQIGGATE